MAQFGRPSSDVSSGPWLPSTSTTLFGVIDEASPDDADFAYTVSTGLFQVGLSSLTDPATSSGHVVRFRMSGDTSTTGVVTLYDTTTSSAISTFTVTSVPAAASTYSFTLTGAAADSISSYSNLRLWFDASTGSVSPVAGFTMHFNASDNSHLFSNSSATSTVNNDELVVRWNSENNSSYYISHSTGTQGYWRSTGMNSTGCLDLDGTDHKYEHIQGGVTLDTVINNNLDTMIVAFILTGNATNNTTNWFQNGTLIKDDGGYRGIWLQTSSGTNLVGAGLYDGADKTVTTTINQGTRYVVQSRHAASTLFMSINGGTEISTTANNVSLLTDIVYITSGLNILHPVKVGELFIYDSDLGASNDTYTYMRNKWGV